MHILYPKTYLDKSDASVEEDTAFVIMPFRSEFLGVFDTIRDSLGQLTPPIEVVRADDLNLGGAIIVDILTGIAKADLVIADLTGKNPNVFYELGICHVVKEDVILLAQNLDDIPFDVRHLRCIAYENSPPGLRDLASKLRSNVRDLVEARRSSKRLERLAALTALRVGDWFLAWTGILKAIAEWPEFGCNDPSRHVGSLEKAAAVLWEFRGGGAYTIDEKGIVIGSFPQHIQGRDVSHREYFRLCSSRRDSVVSNSFDSADRGHSIAVLAVPRFDPERNYLGLLDTVIDIVEDSPLNQVVQSIVLQQEADGADAQVLLIDQRRMVIAATVAGLAGKSIGGNAVIQALLEKASHGSIPPRERGVAACPVENTPFVCVATTNQLRW